MADTAALTNLEDSIGEAADGLVTSWLVVAEVMDPESGARNLTVIRNATGTLWQHLGMLHVGADKLEDMTSCCCQDEDEGEGE